MGHAARQLPDQKKGVPSVGQLRHEALPNPEHVRQDAWHASHVAEDDAKVPFGGQAATQVPPSRNAAPGREHERHALEPPEEQVPQGGSQATQVCPSAHIPAGVHEARQLPWPPPSDEAAKNGLLDVQEVHCPAPGPAHSAQLASHTTHSSADVPEPPAQLKPDSVALQSEGQPSPETRLPSSHASAPTRSPSPQVEAQVSAAPR